MEFPINCNSVQDKCSTECNYMSMGQSISSCGITLVRTTTYIKILYKTLLKQEQAWPFVVICMLVKPPGLCLCTDTSCHGYVWVCPVPLGESMTSAFLHRRLVGLDLKTRLGQDYLRTEDGPFRVMGVTIILTFWILLLKESGKKIWAAQTRGLLITPGDGLICPSCSPSILLPLTLLGLGLYLFLGEISTGLWHLSSSVMTDSHPTKGQQQEQTS